MNEAVLFEESIGTHSGHNRVTIKAELGADGVIQIMFRGREAPTVIYQYSDPAEALAIGKALIRAAQVAGTAGGIEVG